MTDTTTYDVAVDGIGTVPVTVTSRGEGRPYLLLHGGAGPQSVDSFAGLLAASQQARVLTPLHPGFGGTPRPDGLATMGGLAQADQRGARARPSTLRSQFLGRA
ncbi:MAG TPA: hypothetical protein VG268_15680 [Streptosporangiaceae bacterium]|jgi:pimeloyl-ACP methyl ester carboxylesterase|nr:hypothetical protein [Streptosporangiaceae bacterium]